jgi:DNA repair exonuclease SbcCD ATPase subunit
MKLSEIKKLEEASVPTNQDTFSFIQRLKSSLDKHNTCLSAELNNLMEYTNLYKELFDNYYQAMMKKLEIANKYNTETSNSSKNYRNLTINLQGIINPIQKVDYNIEEIQADNKELEQAEELIQEYATQLKSCESMLVDITREVNKRLKSIVDTKDNIDFNFLSFYDN